MTPPRDAPGTIPPTPGIRPVSTDPCRAISIAGERDAPYLARLVSRRPGLFSTLQRLGPDAVLDRARAGIGALAADADTREIARALRRAKDGLHLACAAADLSGLWSLDDLTGALSRFADLAVARAFRSAWRDAGRRSGSKVPLERSGLFVLSMGKLGANELNFSSDIDLVVLFDPSRQPDRPLADQRESSIRTARNCGRLLGDITEEGYVFRVDLRLRPDPRSTAIAISTDHALGYYESVGQNWERMAMIKARFCCGDRDAASAFLEQLQPFVWRRHLDYWAIDDIRAISAQIHAGAEHHDLGDPAFDVKLGRGGIREIEFLAQTRQLIFGGREPRLRCGRTVPALHRLAETAVIGAEQAGELGQAYCYLRALEHRIQMRQDEQTHFLPGDPETRRSVMHLCGQADMAAFDIHLARIRHSVHGAYAGLFEPEERLSGSSGNLVFTGVDDDPGTVSTLSEMGFSNPSALIEAIRSWHRGGLVATRSPRGRGLLTRLTPPLLEAAAATGSPDAAWSRLVDFLIGLRVGVQVFSLLLAEKELTHDLIATMTHAPQLGRDLARRPDLLDAMLGARFHAPLRDDPPGERVDTLAELARADDLEEACDAVRRFKREESLRIGYQLLKRRADALEVGRAYSDLAESCLRALAERVSSDSGIGNVPWAVCGLGRLGAAEMTAMSDLDLILIHEARTDGDQRRATRFAQRLVSALSVPTAEGPLYEVDMRLRPSGRAGPVAVKLSAFKGYYRDRAWTWEYMALTRLRPLAGDPDLRMRIIDATSEAIMHAGSRGKDLRADILDMRRRLERERPAKSRWDLKLAPGGLFDAEFVIQKAMLETPDAVPRSDTGTLIAIDRLHRAGAFSSAEAKALGEGVALHHRLAQALSVADAVSFDPNTASAGLKSWLATIADANDFEALRRGLARRQDRVARLRRKKIGSLATESGS